MSVAKRGMFPVGSHCTLSREAMVITVEHVFRMECHWACCKVESLCLGVTRILRFLLHGIVVYFTAVPPQIDKDFRFFPVCMSSHHRIVSCCLCWAVCWFSCECIVACVATDVLSPEAPASCATVVLTRAHDHHQWHHCPVTCGGRMSPQVYCIPAP